ncbi:MAG: hypothetical protein ACM3MF_03115 [Anaerolineae bacterium]
MPKLAVWFVRACLVYLLIGFTLGALMLAQLGVFFGPPMLIFLPIHMEFLLVGWLVQLAMGVAFWIFPRFGLGLPHSRGNEALIWASFWLLNTGLCVFVLEVWFPGMLLVGRIAEVSAVVIYGLGTWRRIKPHGAQE